MTSELKQYNRGNREKLERFIKRALNKDKSLAEIKSVLVQAGWSPRLINYSLNNELRREDKSRQFRKYFGVALILLITLSLSGIMVFSNLNFTGAFVANNVDWENKIDLTANTSQQFISYHIVFENNKPEKCADGIYIETSDRTIDFRTENEKEPKKKSKSEEEQKNLPRFHHFPLRFAFLPA